MSDKLTQIAANRPKAAMGGIGIKASVPVPATVVIAAPSKAGPVPEIVFSMISLLLFVFNLSSLYLCVTWIAYGTPIPIEKDTIIAVITFNDIDI